MLCGEEITLTKPRLRTLRAGKILFNNKRSVIDCMVRNVSTDGACLMVASVVGIPSGFDLLIEGESAAVPATWSGTPRIK